MTERSNRTQTAEVGDLIHLQVGYSGVIRDRIIRICDGGCTPDRHDQSKVHCHGLSCGFVGPFLGKPRDTVAVIGGCRGSTQELEYEVKLVDIFAPGEPFDEALIDSFDRPPLQNVA